MSGIDIAIFIGFIVMLIVIAVTTNRVTKSVAGFLSSERCAGRYLLTLASSMAFISAASFVGAWQMQYKNGLCGNWWLLMGLPASMIIAMSGWVTYRFRATRALTMPQFLEMRYSKKFRIYAGFLAFIAGVLNCGIFPAVTTNFVMAFLDIDPTFDLLGITLSSYKTILFFMVLAPLTLAVAGGQISIMVTDFFQGTVTNIAIISILVFLFISFNITDVFETLKSGGRERTELVEQKFVDATAGDQALAAGLISSLMTGQDIADVVEAAAEESEDIVVAVPAADEALAEATEALVAFNSAKQAKFWRKYQKDMGELAVGAATAENAAVATNDTELVAMVTSGSVIDVAPMNKADEGPKKVHLIKSGAAGTAVVNNAADYGAYLFETFDCRGEKINDGIKYLTAGEVSIDVPENGMVQLHKKPSMINPFRQADLPDFGPAYFFMMLFISFFTRGVWQGNSGYNSSAKTPHEGRMAFMLGEWRNCVSWSMIVIPIVVWYLMNSASPENMEIAATIQDGLVNATSGGEYTESQIMVPIALREILPAGLVGLVLVMMLGAAVSTDDSCYHSWGSIFLQDAIMPFRKTPFTKEQHMRYLRLSVLGIAICAYCISAFVPFKEYLTMWTTITSAIFVSGAGCAVVGGLYWSRGTALGAWASMIVGSVLAVTSIILRQIWENIESLNNWIAFEDLPNGMIVSVFILIISLAIYFFTSILTCKSKHNMDKMLHRGKYAVKSEEEEKAKHAKDAKEVSWLARKLGFTDEFNKFDKFLYTAQYVWTIGWGASFIIGTAWNLLQEKFTGMPVSDDTWLIWWQIQIGIFISMAVIVTLWYGIGGALNLVDLYRTLGRKNADDSDDGTVQHSADDDVALNAK